MCQVNQTIKKEKIMKETIIILMVVAVAVAKAIMVKEDADDAEEAEEVAAEEAETIVSILKQFNVSIAGEKVTIRPTAPHQERTTLRIPTWYPKRISKIYFNLL
jgi:uncharacterized protein YpmB